MQEALSTNAADMPVKAPAAKTYNWGGCYVGLNGGGAESGSDFTTTVGPGTHLGASDVGAGLEWALDNRWSVAGEYLYARLGATSLSFQTAPLGAGCTPAGVPSCQLNVSESSFTNNIVRLKINYRINLTGLSESGVWQASSHSLAW
jgi:hypothetical protein